MFKRGLALSLVLCMGSFVHAGAIVELVPAGGGGGPYAPCNGGSSYGPGQVVTVEVMLSQSPADIDQYLRMVQLDLTASDAALGSASAMTWIATVNHFSHVMGSRLSNTYYGDLTTPDLGLNTTNQLLLPGDGTPVKVGEFQITMPGAPGSYTLDVLNSGDADADHGGQVRFGYGIAGTSPLTTWREGDLSGGTFSFDVGGAGGATLTLADPDLGESLWRTANNVIILEFDSNIAAPVAGEIMIQEMTAGGVLGADLSANFTFTVTSPTTLEVKETGTVLAHRSWYSFTNTGGWAGVNPFRLQYVVQAGDANGDLRVLFNDLGTINASIPCFVGCDPHLDINGDGKILFNDLGAANTSVPSFPVAKPTGHDCL